MSSISFSPILNSSLFLKQPSNSCCSSFSKGMVVADKICAYVPLVSTLSNGTDLGIKFFIKILTSCHCVSKESIAKNHYLSHITKCSKVRCVVAMLPFLGNVVIATYDIYKTCKKRISNDNKIHSDIKSSSSSESDSESSSSSKTGSGGDSRKTSSFHLSGASKNTSFSLTSSKSSSSLSFEPKNDEVPRPNFYELLAVTDTFYMSRKDSANQLTLNELEAIYNELHGQATSRIENGETDFEIKINPKKDWQIQLKGINHSAGLTVRGGKIELDNMRIHLKTELGRGAERSVEAAITFTGTLLAHPKLIRKNRLGYGGKVVLDGQTRKELEFQQTLKHPNIMELKHLRNKGHGVMPGIYNEILPKSLKLVMPYANSPKRCKKIATQLAGVADGLAYCHSQGVYHRDVKKDNVAVSESGVGKLIDLGLMTKPVAGDLFEAAGTPDYFSPNIAELVIKFRWLNHEELKEQYEIQDCWALACLIFECLHESNGDGTTVERLPLAIQHAYSKNTVDYIINLSQLDFTSRKIYRDEMDEFAQKHGEVGRLVRDTFMARGQSAPKAADFALALRNY